MPRMLYYLLLLAVVAPALSLIGGAKLETAIFIFFRAVFNLFRDALHGKWNYPIKPRVAPKYLGLVEGKLSEFPVLPLAYSIDQSV